MHRNSTAVFFLSLALFGVPSTVEAVDVEASPSQRIKSPEEFLGFEPGEAPVSYEAALAYMRHLASASDYATYFSYGVSDEGLMLFGLIVSSAENLENLPEIRSALDELGSSDDVDDGRISSLPMVAWMGYGIHGDELSPTDAAILLAWRLVATDDEEIRSIRRNVVVYIDPVYNPDGRRRALSHVSTFGRNTPANDSQDFAHNQQWPAGRGNHYFVDLNRDAIFQTQRQSRQRIRAITDASPQLLVSSHESRWDDDYLFALPAEPYNPFLPPAVHDSWSEYSADHSVALDALGIDYYTRAWNEVFYPGFYDIWPAYVGAVPILYEHPMTAGRSVELPTGRIRTFEDAVRAHYVSSVSNLRTAARRKEAFLRRWSQVRSNARHSNASPERRWFILPSSEFKSRETLRILRSFDITVEVLEAATPARGLQTYWDAKPRNITLPPKTLKVELRQSNARLIHNIFDFHVPMSAEFLLKEKRNLDLGYDTQLYDISSWSLPLAFNADIYWSGSSVGGNWAIADSFEPACSDQIPEPPQYAYIYTDDSLYATARMLANGVRIRVGTEAFRHNDRLYPEGTFLVRLGEQPANVRRFLLDEAAGGQICLYAARSARNTEGGPDLGGDSFELVERPRYAILGGAGVRSTSFGAAWHLFDETIGVPVTLLDLHDLDETDLSRYTTIVLPEGSGSLVSTWSADDVAVLNRWIVSGGTLITLGSSSIMASGFGLLSSAARSADLEANPPPMYGRPASDVISNDFVGTAATVTRTAPALPPVVGAPASAFLPENYNVFKPQPAAPNFDEWAETAGLSESDKARLGQDIRRYLPKGAYLRADLKPDHWLGYGVGDRLPVLFRERDALIASGRAEIAARFSSPTELMLSGLVWPEAIGYIAGTSYLLVERKGRGRTVAFAGDPLFRRYSLGTERLFLNAAALANALD